MTVSRDLSYAEVYFTLLGKGEEEGVEAEAVLEKAAGFLRSSLAKNLNTRTTPKLRFHYDTTPEHAAEISRLIDDARAEDRELGLDSDDSEQN